MRGETGDDRGGVAMGRIERGLRLTRISWDILKQDRELLALPLLSFLSLALVAGSLFGAAVGVGLPAEGEQCPKRS
jgi:hypothetical protein